LVTGRLASILRRAAWIVALTLALTSCRLPYIPGATSPPPMAGVTVRNATGRVVGSAVLMQESDGVRILLDLRDFTPGAKAVHIHAVGRCDPPSFESAGPHFNPTKAQHGSANPKGPHAGDLPNITVEATGQGHLEVTNPRVTLESGPRSLFGTDGSSLVVHEGPDDMSTDPDGKSGARVACGVVVRGG
jgi:Cu-Zn family superoxide dismutase